MRLSLLPLLAVPLVLRAQGSREPSWSSCDAFSPQWTDHYGALRFAESQFDDIVGTHRLTAAEAAQRVHYRFEYDAERRLRRVSFRLGAHGMEPNETRWFFFETSSVEICHRDGVEIRRFFDRHGNPAMTKGNVAEERYTLDSLGYRTALTFHNANGRAVQNGWGTARVTWRIARDGTVHETRVDTAGTPAPIRPGFPFFALQMHYGPGGALVLMENVDSVGRLVRNMLNAAQDVIENGADGVMRAWNVYDEHERRVEGNPPMVARGVRTHDRFGSLTSLRHFDRADQPMHDAGGYHEARSSYDRHGNLVHRAWLDSLGRPLSPDGSGVASTRFTYDSTGMRMMSQDFLDTAGRPVRHAAFGAARIVFGYDDAGNQVEVRFQDNGGRGIARADGIAVVRRTYDARSRLVEVVTLGLDDRPIASNGVIGQRFEYRPDGFLARVVPVRSPQ